MKLLQNIFTTFFLTGMILLLVAPVVSTVSVPSSDWGLFPVAEAQEGDSYQFLAPIGGFGESIDVSSTSSFPNYIKTGINVIIGLSIMIAIVLIIAAGFQYMTSTSQSDISDAKSTMGNAIFGLVIALSAVLILQTINPNLIELNAVDTVTTSGASLVVDLNNDEYSEEAYESTGNPYVLGTEPPLKLFEDSISRRGTDPDHAQDQCEAAVDSIVMNSEDEKFDQCKTQASSWPVEQFYFDDKKCSYGCSNPDEIDFISTGYVTLNESGETLVEGVQGISQTEDGAVSLCQTNAKTAAPNSCNSGGFLNLFSGGENGKCTIHCSEPVQME